MDGVEYKEKLKNRILELEKGINGIADFYNNIMNKEATENSHLNMMLSVYANHAKMQVLIKLFNKNFYDEKIRRLEKIIDENIEIQEKAILGYITQKNDASRTPNKNENFLNEF